MNNPKPHIIGLAGAARAGKDECAKWLVANRNYHWITFMDLVYEFCARVFGWTDEQLRGSLKDTPDPNWDGLIPRHAEQQLGTEWGRACHPDLWARVALRRVFEMNADMNRADLAEGVTPHPRFFLITAVRFQNEVDAIHDADGIVLEVVRQGAGVPSNLRNHASEQGGLRGIDGFIDNAGTLQELHTILAACFPMQRVDMLSLRWEP